jgi:hypothetical protein|tara:strand:- start:43 stop:534 length:492 start_codon:yes stop_codon:yes gene_type:complete
MGGRRSAPRVINTPTGPRRPREDRDREDRPTPRPFEGVKRGRIPAPVDMRERPTSPTEINRRERRQESFGDSFRESRRERRRMAGDRKDFFDRVPKRPAPDTRDRVPKPPSDGRGFGMTINMAADATPEQRKAAFDKIVAERGPVRPFPGGRSREQNIARTDV